jgi:hypothetical protein
MEMRSLLLEKIKKQIIREDGVRVSLNKFGREEYSITIYDPEDFYPILITFKGNKKYRRKLYE